MVKVAGAAPAFHEAYADQEVRVSRGPVEGRVPGAVKAELQPGDLVLVPFLRANSGRVAGT